MKTLIVAVSILVTGCSGLMPIPFSQGRVVTPEYLAEYTGGGSMSTLWYVGSDDTYHHFIHYVKVGTPYRIKRAVLNWEQEFAKGTQPSVNASPTLIHYRQKRGLETVEQPS